MAETAPRESQPEVRHLDGTPCPVRDCEECAVQWMLTGNLYLTVPARD